MSDSSSQTDLKNFTPLLDCLVGKYGPTTAAVYGSVWRFAQMENKVCEASNEKIGDRVGVSARTVIRHLKKLCDDGYLIDHTPERKHVPHVYSVTGKAEIGGPSRCDFVSHLIKEEAENPPAEVRQNDTPPLSGMTQSHTGYDTKSYRGVTESHIKKDSKKDSKKEEINTAAQNGVTNNTVSEDESQGADAPPQKHLLKLFVETTGIKAPPIDSKDFKFWWSTLEVICGATDNNLDFAQDCMQEAVNRLRGDNMTISSPKSLVNTVRAIAGEKRSGTTRKDRAQSRASPNGHVSPYDNLDAETKAAMHEAMNKISQDIEV